MKRRSLYDSFRLLRRAYPNVSEGLPAWEPSVCAMLRLPVEATEEEKHIALLQRVTDGTIIQFSDLAKMGYSNSILVAIQQLSPRPGESVSERTTRILTTGDASLIRIEHANQSEAAARAATPEEAASLQPDIARLATQLPSASPHVPSLRNTLKFIQEAFGDKKYNGRPFWIHPLSVMFRMLPKASSAAQHAALLHDVLEDTKHKTADLEEMGYSPRTLWLVRLVTKREKLGLPKLEYLAEIKQVIASGDEEGIRLKHSDMSENMSYLDELAPEKREKVLGKYPLPLRLLTDALNAFEPARSAGR